ncbi:MAG TPA: exodeoxyribonuclease VII large subunit, partial [Chlamydiales bacterium]|nr:exodeoxyribonuclease VII large subunit [Chlamydiales bacterium]
DFVADVRAPTPSAAAEMVIKEKKEMLKDLDNRSHRLKEQIEYQIKTRRLRVQDLKRQPVFYSPYTLLGQKMQRLDDMRTRWEGLGRKLLDHKKILIDAKKNQLKNLSPMLQITNLKQRLTSLEKHLKSLDPKNLLKKGYSILFSEKDSSIILSAKSLSPGARFYALLDDGKVFATAEQVKPNEK